MPVAAQRLPGPAPAPSAAPSAAPEPVVIGFSTPRRWNVVSWAIRFVTGSRASHVWLLVDDPVFRLRMVLEAHSTGFRLVPLTRFRETNRVVALAIPTVDLWPGVAAAGGWLGKKYDYAGLFGMAKVLVGRWLRCKWKNPVQSSAAVFCSEAVVQVLREASYPGVDELDPDDTSPGDLLAFLEGSGCCEIVRGRALALRRQRGEA